MKADAETDASLATTLKDAVNAVRGVIGIDRIELIAATEGNIGLMIAWALLFRSLNLVESTVQAAQVGNGEVVALTARSLAELCYLVGFMGPNMEKAASYVGGTYHALDKWLETVSKEANDPAIRKAAEATRVKILGVPKSVVEQWESKIKARAKAANMEQDYLVRYALLCEEAHHGERALAHYMRECQDGIEIRPRVEDRQIWLWLCLATFYWAQGIQPLLSYLGFGKATRLKKAFHTLTPWLALKEDTTLPEPQAKRS